MTDRSPIEWTDATWNPVRGCTRVSEGCRNCYAEALAARFSKTGQWGRGFAEMKTGSARWTSKVKLIEEQLDLPLHWKKPRRIFVNSTSDLFHEALPDEALARVFNVMAETPQHTYQVLTKRAGRMRDIMDGPKRHHLWSPKLWHRSVLPNVWLGVSVEDQEAADARIPELLATPAALRFISAEPLLGPLDIIRFLVPPMTACQARTVPTAMLAKISRAAIKHITGAAPFLDWIITGGESGPGARPMHPDWARSLRDQCAATGVPFFFKQWGNWSPHNMLRPDGQPLMSNIGKKLAGRLLDGREHNEFPR